MKRLFINGLVAIAMLAPVSIIAPKAEATFTAATVSRTGASRQGTEQFFEIKVGRDALQRVRVQCVTFHTLDDLDVYVGGKKVAADVQYGFEEFTVSFPENVPSGETIRIVMKNSRVRGAAIKGFAVPFRVFGNYATINGEVPLGTAIISTPQNPND